MENEIELIKGCRAGQDSARKELYTLYAKQMLAVCYRYTGDMDAAHDVLHDGFIKIFTNFSFRGEASLCTWITTGDGDSGTGLSATAETQSHQVVVHEEQLPDIPDISSSGGGSRDLRRTTDGVCGRTAGWLPNRISTSMCLRRSRTRR